MSEPRTEAGKRLLASTLTDNDPDALRRTILAIEAEAAADGDLTTAYMVGYEKGKAAASPSTDTSTALLDVERLARARHRWQHPTYALDLTPVKPGLSRRCGCFGWAQTVQEMLDLLAETEAPATLSVTPQDTTEPGR